MAFLGGLRCWQSISWPPALKDADMTELSMDNPLAGSSMLIPASESGVDPSPRQEAEVRMAGSVCWLASCARLALATVLSDIWS